MKIRILGALLPIVGLVLVVQTAHAQTVSSYTATPTSVSSGILTNLSWTLENSTGYTVLLTCPTGVTAYTSTGSLYPCDSRQSVTSAGSDSLGLSFVNITGSVKNVTARLYPKDGAGADADSASAQVNIQVAPIQNVISDVTVSSYSPASGSTLTFTWTSHHISNVNARFDCGSDLVITSSQSTTPIVCNSGVSFSSDLAASGSQSVVVVNKSLFPAPLTIRLFPLITTGAYDATNAKSVEVSVLGAVAAVDASAVSFTSAATTVVSNATTSFAWVTANAQGANLQIVCAEDVSIFDSAGMALPCGQPAFQSSITAASSTSLRLLNKGTAQRQIRVTLLLQRADGTYLPAAGKDILLTLLKAGGNASLTQVAAPMVTTAPKTTPAASGKAHTPITVTLTKGMKHLQVSILQTFLALDSALYPENSVSGYFGPATEAALKRFQKKHSLAKEGSAGFGAVGPATRAKINSLLKP